MNKILTTALGLFVGGVLSASAYTASTTVYSTNRDDIKSVNVWGGNTTVNKHAMSRVAGTAGNGYYYTANNTFTNIQISDNSDYDKADFGNNKGQYSTSSGYVMECWMTGATAATTINDLKIWMKNNGTDKAVGIDSQTSTPYVFITETLTTNGSDLIYGFRNGSTWLWNVNNLTGSGDGAYVGIFDEGAKDNNTSIGLANGTQYHFEVNIIDQTIKVVSETTTPIETPQNLYIWTRLGTSGTFSRQAAAVGTSLSNDTEVTFTKTFSSDHVFDFYFSSTGSAATLPADGFYAPANVSYVADGSNYNANAGTGSSNYRIDAKAGETWTLTLKYTDNFSKLNIVASKTGGEPENVTQDLYLHVEGVKGIDGWGSHFYLGNEMETEYSKSFEISGETFNFVFSNSESISWDKADGFYAPKDGNKLISLGTESTQSQNDGKNCLYAGNGAGTYTVKAKYNADHTAVTFTVTKEEGGNNNNEEDPQGYETTSLGFDIDAPVDLSLKSYYIPTPDLVPNKQGYKKQLEVKHSHAGRGNLEYTWVKYHDPSEGYSSNWMYYESDDNIPEADDRVGIIQTHPWYKNKTASEISGRAHAVNNNSGTSHDCRNFSDAYYRVYGEMDEHPDKFKAISRARQIGHITPGNLSKKARVAYTLAVSDNTSGIDEVAADAAATDAAPVYYNLQGVVVANPQAGQVYIVRRGETVTKELYR